MTDQGKPSVCPTCGSGNPSIKLCATPHEGDLLSLSPCRECMHDWHSSPVPAATALSAKVETAIDHVIDEAQRAESLPAPISVGFPGTYAELVRVPYLWPNASQMDGCTPGNPCKHHESVPAATTQRCSLCETGEVKGWGKVHPRKLIEIRGEKAWRHEHERDRMFTSLCEIQEPSAPQAVPAATTTPVQVTRIEEIAEDLAAAIYEVQQGTDEMAIKTLLLDFAKEIQRAAIEPTGF